MVALRKLLRQLAKAKQQSLHNMLITVVTGCSWTAPRLATAGRGGPPTCYRCGVVGITDWHTYWECPALALSTNPELTSSQHLLPKACSARQGGRDSTFWLRGLVKAELTQAGISGGTEVWCIRFDDTGQPCERVKYPTWQAAIDDNLNYGLSLGSFHVFSDGSGGKGTSDRRLRACGWSAVFMRSHFVAGLAFYGQLPGREQTVPRAELAFRAAMSNS